jgi:hypothetical protein
LPAQIEGDFAFPVFQDGSVRGGEVGNQGQRDASTSPALFITGLTAEIARKGFS